jgi:hypothetical protein
VPSHRRNPNERCTDVLIGHLRWNSQFDSDQPLHLQPAVRDLRATTNERIIIASSAAQSTRR